MLTPKVKYTLIIPKDSPAKKFFNKWNNLPRSLAVTQRNIMNNLLSEIKHEVENDTRPPKWRGHVYTGSLLSNTRQETKVTGRAIESKIGFFVDHGRVLEGEVEVSGNRFVSLGVHPRPESFSDLYNWAYDIVTRRTTGKKIYGAAAKSKATRWAEYLKALIENHGQPGYPIIIPAAERLFNGDDTMHYIDQISEVIKDRMQLRGSEKVPF